MLSRMVTHSISLCSAFLHGSCAILHSHHPGIPWYFQVFKELVSFVVVSHFLVFFYLHGSTFANEMVVSSSFSANLCIHE